jgi:hypothetical protein
MYTYPSSYSFIECLINPLSYYYGHLDTYSWDFVNFFNLNNITMEKIKTAKEILSKYYDIDYLGALTNGILQAMEAYKSQSESKGLTPITEDEIHDWYIEEMQQPESGDIFFTLSHFQTFLLNHIGGDNEKEVGRDGRTEDEVREELFTYLSTISNNVFIDSEINEIIYIVKGKEKYIEDANTPVVRDNQINLDNLERVYKNEQKQTCSLTTFTIPIINDVFRFLKRELSETQYVVGDNTNNDNCPHWKVDRCTAPIHPDVIKNNTNERERLIKFLTWFRENEPEITPEINDVVDIYLSENK